VASFVPDVLRIRRLIRALDIDLVVIGGLVNPHAAIAGWLAGVPVIWQIIDSRPPGLVRALLRPVVGRFATVVMTTGTTIARVNRVPETMADRWIPFFSPVDISRFAPTPAQRARAREELGFRPDDTVVGTVGTINPQKGHDTFIRAAAELIALRPGTRFLILGAGHDTHEGLERALWRLAGDLGLEVGRDLVVQDPMNRVDELAQAMDVFWLTSQPRSEGVPTVIMEAMALGLPVVSTDVGGVREIVEDGVTGRVVPPQSPSLQARATVPMLDDPATRRQMGEAGREQAIARFRTEICVSTHLRAFDLALRRHRGPGKHRPS
jgi:glycosyltransferase involved in cell wall biosynthesis